MKLSICPCSLDLAHLPPPLFPCLVVHAHVPLPIRLANFSRLFAPFTVAHFRLLIRPCSLVRTHLAAAHLPLQFALPICPCTSPFVHWPLLIYLRPFALAHPSLPICPCPFVLSHLPLPLSPRQLVRGRAPLPSAVIHMPLSICLCPSTLAYSPLPICAHLPLPIRSYPSALVHLFVPLCHDTFALAYFPVSIRPCQFAIAHLTFPCALVHLPLSICLSPFLFFFIYACHVLSPNFLAPVSLPMCPCPCALAYFRPPFRLSPSATDRFFIRPLPISPYQFAINQQPLPVCHFCHCSCAIAYLLLSICHCPFAIAYLPLLGKGEWAGANGQRRIGEGT